jgi:hypothetical protein
MLGPCLAGLLLALPPSPRDEPPATAEVVAEALEILDEPDEAAFPTGRVRRGDRVAIRSVEPGGWLAIEPPAGSFSWIDRTAIEEDEGTGRARVVVARAAVRLGQPGARMPGVVGSHLEEGSIVHLRDRPPLTLRQGATSRTWRAIAPPEDEVRYIRASGVALARGPSPVRRSSRVDSLEPPLDDPISPPGPPRPLPPTEVGPVSRTFATVGGSRAQLDPDFAQALAQVEAWHREALRLPVEAWQLEPTRKHYEALLGRATDPSSRDAVRARLAQVARQEEVARDARSVQALLERSRRRDQDLEALRRDRPEPEAADDEPYEAEGLLQPSSKQVEGRKVDALIGADGTTTAYLLLPPGLRTDTLLARRVGVRGSVHFDEALRARVITVREMDPLDVAP